MIVFQCFSIKMDGSIKLLKDTLEHLGHTKEDIETVFKSHKGPINFSIATKKLDDLKESRKVTFGFNHKTYPSSKMIVISDSEDDSSDDDITDRPPLVTVATEKSYQFAKTHPVNYDVDQVDDDNFAHFDLPDQSVLLKWFKESYQPKFDAVVLKEDLFKHFCEHFKTPNYDELEKLFFQKVEIMLDINSSIYADVQCIENTYYEGLQKVDLQPTSVSHSFQKMLNPSQQPRNFVEDNTQAAKTTPTSYTIPNQTRVNLSAVTPSANRAIKKEKVKKNVLAAKFPSQPQKKESGSPKNTTFTSQIQDLWKVPGNSSGSDVLPSTSNSSTSANASTNRSMPSSSHTERELAPTSLLAESNFKQAKKADYTTHERHVQHLSNKQHLDLPSMTMPSSSLTKRELTPTSLLAESTFNQARKADYTTDERHVQHLSNKQLLDLPSTDGDYNLRPIVIDGSNIACSHGNGNVFSCRGLALCVRYFWLRGHRDIICFLPNYRKAPGGSPPIKGREIIFDLEKMNICKFTPSRKVDGKYIISYDDRFILDLAEKNQGVVVSNDQYRDLIDEKQKWKNVIVYSLLPYVFAQDFFMPAEDPLGRNGPKLDNFLEFTHRMTRKNVKQQNILTTSKPTAHNIAGADVYVGDKDHSSKNQQLLFQEKYMERLNNKPASEKGETSSKSSPKTAASKPTTTTSNKPSYEAGMYAGDNTLISNSQERLYTLSHKSQEQHFRESYMNKLRNATAPETHNTLPKSYLNSTPAKPVAAPRTKFPVNSVQRHVVTSMQQPVMARSFPINTRGQTDAGNVHASARERTNKAITTEDKLKALFPDCKDKIEEIIKKYPTTHDVNFLANLLLIEINDIFTPPHA